jgi:hypothetical protein
MDIKEDGTIVEIEKALDGADRPAKVMDAVKAKYPKAEIEEVMEKSLVKGKEEKVHEYEVVIKHDGKTQELTVSPDGKIEEEAGEEHKGKDKDDEKDEDDEKKEDKK